MYIIYIYMCKQKDKDENETKAETDFQWDSSFPEFMGSTPKQRKDARQMESITNKLK